MGLPQRGESGMGRETTARSDGAMPPIRTEQRRERCLVLIERVRRF
jgi:hypothetical protein